MNWYDYNITHGFYPQYEAGVGDTPHWALDLGTPMDTPVTAPHSGSVVYAGFPNWRDSRGQFTPGGGEVIVQSDIPELGKHNFQEYWLHLDEEYVKKGDRVQAGQRIGLSGGQNAGGHHN